MSKRKLKKKDIYKYKNKKSDLDNIELDTIKEDIVDTSQRIETNNLSEKVGKNLKKKFFLICLFIFFPIIFIALLYLFIQPRLINFMIKLPLNNPLYFEVSEKNSVIINSEGAINHIISPFCSSVTLIILFFASYFIIKFCSNKWFDDKVYIIFAKKILQFVEIVILVLGLISVFYVNVEKFKYTDTTNYENYISYLSKDNEVNYFKHTLYEDGVEIANTDNPSKPGEPSIESVGLNSSDARIDYKIMLLTAQVVKKMSEYFSLIITILGAMIFPLKRYINNSIIKNSN